MSALTIGLSLSPTWLRGQAWRRADSRVEELFAADVFVEAARLAEESGLDFLFRPDALALDPAPLATSPGFSSLDPIVLMCVLARETTRIGLVPTVSATFAHPHTVARQLQSLDQITAGRVGWNVVTSLGGGENFGDVARPADPYRNAEDFVAVVEALRQTYPSSAVRMDRAAGVFADVARLGTVPPRGRYDSAGPVTVPAVSAHRWPLLHAGGSPASLEFAARHADAIFAMTAETADGLALRARLDDASARTGRGVRMLPGLSVTLAPRRADAQELAAAPGDAPSHVRHWSVVGTPQDAVDSILRRAESGAADGLIVLPGGSWQSLELFCTEVVPALRDAGLVPHAHGGTTLRARLRDESPEHEHPKHEHPGHGHPGHGHRDGEDER